MLLQGFWPKQRVGSVQHVSDSYGVHHGGVSGHLQQLYICAAYARQAGFRRETGGAGRGQQKFVLQVGGRPRPEQRDGFQNRVRDHGVFQRRRKDFEFWKTLENKAVAAVVVGVAVRVQDSGGLQSGVRHGPQQLAGVRFVQPGIDDQRPAPAIFDQHTVDGSGKVMHTGGEGQQGRGHTRQSSRRD